MKRYDTLEVFALFQEIGSVSAPDGSYRFPGGTDNRSFSLREYK